MTAHGISSVQTVFGFAFDIVKDSERASGYAPADDHLGSFEPLYGQARAEGFAAMMLLGFARHLIIPGKVERRYKNESVQIDGKDSPIWQGYAIRKMLVEDYGCDPHRIGWIRSDGSTDNAALAIRDWMREEQMPYGEGYVEFVTSWYHCIRTSRVSLRRAGLPTFVTPAESFSVALGELRGNRRETEERLRSFGGHYTDSRVIAEISGIADSLLGRYESKKEGW